MAGIVGMSRTTGQEIDGLSHLGQSIVDILTTPKGTRVMRRDYGAGLADLLDSPINPEAAIDVYAEIADALATWEPRFEVSDIDITSVSTGTMTVKITGIYTPDGSEVTLEGIVI